MELLLLPLGFVGWFFTVASAVALVAGALVIIALHRAGELQRRYLEKNVLNDMMLFGIWFLGLAGGIGVIARESWARGVLEFFCWTLIVLVLLSTANRFKALRQQQGEAPVNWAGAFAGVVMFAVPILALCAAAIVTLRSPAALQAFAG
jgi:FtsH-binding integral membrane protein